MGLFDPILGIVSKGLDATINPVGLGRLILHLLGPETKDELTARFVDGAIKGGAMIEAVDGAIAKSYVKKLREYAEKLAKG